MRIGQVSLGYVWVFSIYFQEPVLIKQHGSIIKPMFESYTNFKEDLGPNPEKTNDFSRSWHLVLIKTF